MYSDEIELDWTSVHQWYTKPRGLGLVLSSLVIRNEELEKEQFFRQTFPPLDKLLSNNI